MKVGIIGGGAAGIMSALFACKKDEVTVIEHNDKLLKKILSTGNGKCNFTNLNIAAEHYHNNKRAMKYIQRFNQYDVIKFFNSLGVVEYIRDCYVYPGSEQAASIRTALLIKLKRCNVKVILNAKITDISKENAKITVKFRDKYDGKFQNLCFDKVIVATGLNAAPKLGSDASIFPILEKLGVKYNKYLPALCGIYMDKPEFFKAVTGVRSKGSIAVCIDNQIVAKDFGELQFNDTGISGIPAFQVSRYVSLALEKGKDIKIILDIFSHFRNIAKNLNKRKQIFKTETLEDFGNGLINSKLWLGILKLVNIKPETKVTECNNEILKKILDICTNMEFNVIKMADFDKCQACTGGISLKNLDETLMYKDIKNLYFAGEIIDVDGICGGYNLQWAWTSGYIAGGEVNNDTYKYFVDRCASQ